MSKKLFENSDSDSENEITNELKTNEQYANVYNKFRQKELIKKLKDRGLDNSDDDTESDSSESTISDEDACDPEFDEEFYKTLSSLKSKDPDIYDKNLKFFEKFENIKKDKSESNKEKALTLKDYERKVILEKGGVYEDDEDEEEYNTLNKRPMSPSYAEEQKQLREEFRKFLNDENDEENEEFGGIFKKRNKTKEEKDKEEENFVQWLAGRKQDIDENKKKTLNPLKQYWNNPNLPKEEQFLRDYVLNNGYINKQSKDIPTYEEIIGDNDEENLSEDEKELEKQLEFENKYNFRFEEPDKEFIKRYPRTIENSVRKIDDKRKLKRQEIKERKQKEKEQKFQEIEMLKELKRKEIEEKIEKLKEVTGNDELPFDTNDLDEDFDPKKHDERMKKIFNDDYYQVDEGEEKPDCPDIDELKIEDWDNYDPKNGDDDDDGKNYGENEQHCEDDDFIMDCDYDKNKEKLQNELIEMTQDNRKKRKRRKNRFMEMIKTEKPAFNPEDEKTYAEYIEEYYKMDCEDIIDDIPCRFKYVETVPNDFGLTIEEILLAKNKELNQWASLKKAVQIRPEHLERNEVKLYKLKAQNLKLKKKIFRSLYGSSSEDEDEEEEKTIGEKNEESDKKNEMFLKKNKNDQQKVNDCNKIKSEENENEKTKIEKVEDTEKVSSDMGNRSIKIKNKNKKDKSAMLNSNGTNKESSMSSPSIMNKKRKNKFNNSENENADKESSTSSQIVNKKRKNKFNSNNGNDTDKKSSTSSQIVNNKRKNPFNSDNISSKLNKKKKYFDKSINSSSHGQISEERLKAYGLNPRKFYKKQKFMQQNKFKNRNKS